MLWSRGGVIAASLMQPLLGSSLMQVQSFEATNASLPYYGSGNENLVNPGFFSATFDPFPDELGTLTSFKMTCEINGQLVGTVDETADSGTASGGLGGTFAIGGVAFNGTGGSNGTGAGPGGVLDVEFGIPKFEQTLAVANAGVTYDPSIYAIVDGDVAYTASFSSSVSIGYSNVVDLNAQVSGSITMTYYYLDAVTQEPSALKITRLIPNRQTGDVLVEWVSEGGKGYAIDASTNFVDWVTVDRVFGAVSLTEYIEAGVVLDQPKRFYRIRETP